MAINTSVEWFYIGTVIYTMGSIICSLMFIAHLLVTLHQHGYAQWIDTISDYCTLRKQMMQDSAIKNASRHDHDLTTSNHTPRDASSGKVELSSPATSMNSNHSHSTHTGTGARSGAGGKKSKHVRTKSESAEDKHSLAYFIVQISTLACVFFFTMHGWSGFVSKLRGFSKDNAMIPCLNLVQSGSVNYICAKIFMYLIMILRLELAYGESTYAYSKKLIYAMCVVVLVWGIPFIALTMMTMGCETPVVYSGSKTYHLCNTVNTSLNTAIMVLFDLFISVFSLVCFIRPLRTLRANMRTVGVNTETTRLERLSTKYTITVSVAVVTTVLNFAAIAMLSSAALIMIDIVINCVCIGLMCSVYDRYYEALCCGLIRCCQFKEAVAKRLHNGMIGSVGSFGSSKSTSSQPGSPRLPSQ